ITPAAQRALKAAIVADALRHVGRLEPPAIGLGPALPATGYRTTMRVAVRDGKPALRHRGSHDLVGIDGCLVAHPRVAEVIDTGRFGSAADVTVRAAVATGERLVRVDRDDAIDTVEVPPGVVVVGRDGRGAVHEDVAGHRFRVSARSFFQARPDGAAALVDLVRAAAGDLAGTTLLDLYAGVGLFAVT